MERSSEGTPIAPGSPAAGKDRSDAVVQPRVPVAIGAALRRHYAELVSDPLPASILKLCEELERKEAASRVPAKQHTNGE